MVLAQHPATPEQEQRNFESLHIDFFKHYIVNAYQSSMATV